MNVSTRLAVYAGLLILTGLGVAATGPDLVLGNPFTETREAQQNMRQAVEVSKELDERDQAVLRRMAERQQIAREVADGRLTLHQAAARFRLLNSEEAACRGGLAFAFPGRTEEERLCRQVIAWTRGAFVGQPTEHAERVINRLKAELDAEQGDSHVP
jgi:chorismate mutase